MPCIDDQKHNSFGEHDNDFLSNKHLTNAYVENSAIYRLAAKNSGFDVYVGQAAVPMDQNKRYIGVYTNEPHRDHGKFWNEVNRLFAIIGG